MSESFHITVNYKGEDQDIEVLFQVFGYFYRFEVTLEGTVLVIEKDEEGEYRALIPWDNLTKARKSVDPQLIRDVIAAIGSAFK
jgi:hypothetical protein